MGIYAFRTRFSCAISLIFTFSLLFTLLLCSSIIASSFTLPLSLPYSAKFCQSSSSKTTFSHCSKTSATSDDRETMTTPSPKSTIPTTQLLSTLIDAARHGSQTIQSLCQKARSNTDGNAIKFKEEGEARSALTIADIAAQKVIVSSLLGKFPELNIVGEEDESAEVDLNSKKELDDGLFSRAVLDFHLPQHLLESKEAPLKEMPSLELELEKLVVFVDPLDGTREFVEGRLENVQCLIGVCYEGTPLMGAIGLPFPTAATAKSSMESSIDNDNASVEVVFGLVGKGIGKAACGNDIGSCTLPDLKKYQKGDGISISSGDSSSIRPAVDLAAKLFEASSGKDVERQIVGACGNKLLRVTYGHTTLCLQHDKTSLWDTCAPSAILASVGGMVTDYFGDPLIYNKKELGNKLGVVASVPGANMEHLQLVKAMRGDRKTLSILEKYGLSCNEKDEDSEQCVDIVRDLDGYPLSSAFFAEKMDIEGTKSYSCPENEAVRGLMSIACRVHLHPSGKTAFFKRIVFENLDHAWAKMKSAPHKLVRDVKSYQVETSFLASRACQQVIEKAGLRIPKCYDAKLLPNDANPIESKFSVLLEDFAPSDGWSQRWLLRTDEECRATLTTLAKMHAFFWNGSSFWQDEIAAKELENGVWGSASYVQPNLQTLNQCKEVAKGWAKNKIKCQSELESFDFWDDLGIRLENVAEEAGRSAHPFAENDELSAANQKFKTFTHGDPKQANLFFRTNVDSSLEVGLIDFQWAGFGLAATDVAHFLSAAVHADRLAGGGEEALLKYYFEELQSYLVEFGNIKAKKLFEYETFLQQYETGILDMCRLVIAYAWSRFEQIDEGDEAGYARTMNKNSYNKSIANVIWLMSRCDQILKKRGVSE